MAEPIDGSNTKPTNDTPQGGEPNEVNNQEIPEGGTPQGANLPKQDDFDPVGYIESVLETAEIPDEQKEAVKKGYMLHKDYTQKTQQIADARKTIEQWQPILEKISSSPELFNYVTTYKGGQPAPQGPTEPQEEEIPTDPREYANYVETRAVNKMREQMAKDQDLARAETVDARLQSSKPEDKAVQRVVLGLISQDEDFKAGRKSAELATKEAIAWYDSNVAGQARKQATNAITQKVQ